MMMREIEYSEGKECSYISRSRAYSALLVFKAGLYRRRWWVVFGVASDVIGFPSDDIIIVTPAQRNHLHGHSFLATFGSILDPGPLRILSSDVDRCRRY
jgi:hypothetical protein